jgi:bifunctional DNA-binding transcriptional regulator/antitoxin component of YhaV-PrlF toxin-antitoxin module
MSGPKESVPEVAVVSGFGVVDERGRLTLAKPVREVLGLRPGSAVAYIAVDDRLLVIRQDEHLARLADDAAAALRRIGLTTDDLLADLPAAGEAAMRATYGDALVDEQAALHARISGRRDE